MAASKIENLQALRGVAALMVFVAHLAAAEGDYGSAPLLLPFALNLGQVGVDLFFVISGFVMVHVTMDGPRGRRAATRFIYNRGARIFPLYWVATSGLVALYAGKKFAFGEDTPLGDLVGSFLLLPTGELPLLAVGWTLTHELYFYAAFALFLLMAPGRLPMLLFAWGLLVAAGAALTGADASPFVRLIFNPLTFEFLAGAAVALLVRRGVTGCAAASLALGGGAVLALAIGFARDLYPAALADHMQRVLIFGAPMAAIAYGAVALEAAPRPRIAPRWLRQVGDASYALYLLHVPTFLVVGKAVTTILAPGAATNAVLIAAYAATGLAVAFLAHEFVEKPLLRMTRRFGDSALPRAAPPHAAAPHQAGAPQKGAPVG